MSYIETPNIKIMTITLQNEKKMMLMKSVVVATAATTTIKTLMMLIIINRNNGLKTLTNTKRLDHQHARTSCT